ncbi:hypothetical protein [Nocardioides sp. LHG3406-4]|uniref:hypothetical protein n=1 Tax=Nocardioides sp. LHG3406-4 TaxID=2804575 RepID=UPI003CFB5094
MRTITRLAAAAVAATLLAAPAVAIAPANADTTAVTAQAPTQALKAKKISLKLSKKYSHYGQEGVKVTAKVKGKGKVKFTQNGTVIGTDKVKKGKASVRLPQTNAPGVYKIKAKWKKSVAKAKVTVYDSSLSLSGVAFTVSKSATTAPPSLTGTVKFKGKVGTTGYVDIYKNGNVKGGSSSPDYCCMASVQDDGSFEFSGYTFLDEVAEKEAPGTYSYQAFYTDDAGFDDYIYSAPITVTVVP